MDITLSINSAFDTVFLVNGSLLEGGDIIYGENEVIYITVLPLSALLQSYTVKMVGGLVKSNPELVKCYQMRQDRFFIKFLPRYSFVYSVTDTKLPQKRDIIEKFFYSVLDKKTAEARGYMSRELNDSIDDKSLLAFFDDFKDIVVSDTDKGLYYLIDKENHGVLYNFVVKNGVIDNLVEL